MKFRKSISCLLVIVSIASLTGLTGCGKKTGTPAGKTKIVERSHRNRPSWTSKITTEDRTNYYYSGMASGRDYALSVRLAKAEGVKNMVEAIESKVRTEFTSVTTEIAKDAQVARFIEDGISMLSENVRVRGLTYNEVYYEKSEKALKDAVEYYYDVWARISIKKEDYVEARKEVVERMIREAQLKNSQVLMETAKTLKERLATGSEQ
jgi:hypothetical protein